MCALSAAWTTLVLGKNYTFLLLLYVNRLHRGRGGFMWAIAKLSPAPQQNYEAASEMGDLHLGDAHLVQVDDDSTLIRCYG